MNRGKVYVVQHDGRFSVNDAIRFGDLVVVFRKDLFPDNANEMAASAVEHASNTLKNFNTATDYLCLIGSPLYVAICSAILGAYVADPKCEPKQIKLLRFDKIEQAYYPIVI